MIYGLLNGCYIIGRIKSDRVIYLLDIKIEISKFSKHINNNEITFVTAGDNIYYV
ncbi:transposase (fragment) [Clostridium beijerinckii]